jgi:hypothetical protein
MMCRDIKALRFLMNFDRSSGADERHRRTIPNTMNIREYVSFHRLYLMNIISLADQFSQNIVESVLNGDKHHLTSNTK